MMWDSKRQKKNLLSQCVCTASVNYAEREQEKPLLFKLILKSRFTLSQAQSDSCHELLVLFGLSTVNSNGTNHKPRKKLANQKCRHMSLPLCGIRTRYCALIPDALYRSFRASAKQANTESSVRKNCPGGCSRERSVNKLEYGRQWRDLNTWFQNQWFLF